MILSGAFLVFYVSKSRKPIVDYQGATDVDPEWEVDPSKGKRILNVILNQLLFQK